MTLILRPGPTPSFPDRTASSSLFSTVCLVGPVNVLHHEKRLERLDGHVCWKKEKRGKMDGHQTWSASAMSLSLQVSNSSTSCHWRGGQIPN